MLDLFNLPFPGNADIQVFTAHGTASTGVIQSYLVPRGKSTLFIYCLSAGGGGGGGFSGAAGTARGGGGGGASGGFSTLLINANLLPRQLYVYVERGGTGGAAGSGGNGTNVGSHVTIAPSLATVTNYVLTSPLANASGAGSASAGGTGGAALAASAITSCPLAGLGLFSSFGGQNGTAGGAHTGLAGTAISLPTTGINVMGGTGGGGTTSADFAGGAITAVSNSYISESRPEAATAGSIGGSGGFKLKDLMFNYPGLGGGSSNTGVGGDGGNGGFGCGGGGGGGGTTGGRGGNGGSGLVVMIAW